MRDINSEIQRFSEMVDNRLEELLACEESELLFSSMKYSVEAGGKRLRPVLTLLVCDLLEGDVIEALDIACAIEMIHTYSLIHDDLPALDNDSMRRGRPTNHTVYGEAQAILAGDGLLNFAYEVMLNNALVYEKNLKFHVNALSIVARAAGVFGMIAGQVQDVHHEGKPINEEMLNYIHTHKTGDMITGAVLAGAQIAGAKSEEFQRLYEYSTELGMVFQIVDDVLDTMDVDMGKTAGKDALAGKTTFASLYGNEVAMQKARHMTDKAIEALSYFGQRAEYLCELAKMMLERSK